VDLLAGSVDSRAFWAVILPWWVQSDPVHLATGTNSAEAPAVVSITLANVSQLFSRSTPSGGTPSDKRPRRFLATLQFLSLHSVPLSRVFALGVHSRPLGCLEQLFLRFTGATGRKKVRNASPSGSSCACVSRNVQSFFPISVKTIAHCFALAKRPLEAREALSPDWRGVETQG